MRKLGLSTAAIGAGMLASGLAANAQYFNYTATFLPGNSSTFQIFTAGTGGNYGVLMAGGSNNTGQSTPTNITVASLTTFAPTNATSTTSISGAYSVALAVTLTDINGASSGTTLTRTYGGILSGTVTGNSAFVNNAFTIPGPQTYSFANGSAFTITLTSYTPPGGPGSATPGAIGASVIGNSVQFTTPEPGSITLLAGAAVPGVMLGLRRRRRKVA